MGSEVVKIPFVPLKGKNAPPVIVPGVQTAPTAPVVPAAVLSAPRSEPSPDGRGEFLTSPTVHKGAVDVIFVGGIRTKREALKDYLPKLEKLLGVSGIAAYYNHSEGAWNDL